MDSGRWRAPAAHGPVRATLRLPGSKSITNRALILAALSDSTSLVRGVLKARDTSLAIAALRALGVAMCDGGRGALPCTGHGRGSVPGGRVTLDASGSSQLVSGLLLAAPRFAAGAEVRRSGPPVPSLPHIEMSVRMLRDAGATVEV